MCAQQQIISEIYATDASGNEMAEDKYTWEKDMTVLTITATADHTYTCIADTAAGQYTHQVKLDIVSKYCYK